jgi:DNA-binding NarL/FixJ family response regulator
MAGAFEEAVATIHNLQPDVVVLDVGTQRSLPLIRAVRVESPATHVVAFGLGEHDQDIIACAEAGVTGYVPADCSAEELIEAIESAARGELRCSPRTAALLVRHLAALADGKGPMDMSPSLTAREREIASLIEQGLSNKQIAVQLDTEIGTVKNHVHNILDKLGAATRGEAAARLRREASRRSLRLTPSHPTSLKL